MPGPHFCLEEKQPFFGSDWPGFLPGNCFEEYRHQDAFWIFKWRWAFIVGWTACSEMGELHVPLQVSDSLSNLGPWQLRGDGERAWETAAPAIRCPALAKYLLTVFGNCYVQNIYIQYILQGWKEGASSCWWRWKHFHSHTFGIWRDSVLEWWNDFQASDIYSLRVIFHTC